MSIANENIWTQRAFKMILLQYKNRQLTWISLLRQLTMIMTSWAHLIFGSHLAFFLCFLSELHKNSMNNLEQILEALWPLTSHLKNNPSKMNKTCRHCWRTKDELIRDGTSVGWPTRTFPHHLCTDAGCSLEDLSGAMDDRDRWRERFRGICASSVTWWEYLVGHPFA